MRFLYVTLRRMYILLFAFCIVYLCHMCCVDCTCLLMLRAWGDRLAYLLSFLVMNVPGTDVLHHLQNPSSFLDCAALELCPLSVVFNSVLPPNWKDELDIVVSYSKAFYKCQPQVREALCINEQNSQCMTGQLNVSVWMEWRSVGELVS